MRALHELLSFANREERRKAERETEKRLFPLWLATYAITKIRDPGAEVMEYEAFLKECLSPPGKTEKTKRAPEDIVSEFMPLVEADRKKGG